VPATNIKTPSHEVEHVMDDMARDVGRLEGRLQALEDKVSIVERSIDERLGAIEQKLDRLTEAFNMGRGAAITVAKLGGLLLLASGTVAWFVDHMTGWAR
jgi:hypothetical protein